MIVPDHTAFPPPNEDTPENIRADYLEAASISARSPRGAAALLRLCIQNLCIELGYKEAKINDSLANMVADGLPASTMDAFDVVRVVGNSAVHPGQIDLKDDEDAVATLARLFNIVVEDRISKPKHIRDSFDKLPQSVKDAIAKRNAKASGSTP